jgi:hypothetical protein
MNNRRTHYGSCRHRSAKTTTSDPAPLSKNTSFPQGRGRLKQNTNPTSLFMRDMKTYGVGASCIGQSQSGDSDAVFIVELEELGQRRPP